MAFRAAIKDRWLPLVDIPWLMATGVISVIQRSKQSVRLAIRSPEWLMGRLHESGLRMTACWPNSFAGDAHDGAANFAVFAALFVENPGRRNCFPKVCSWTGSTITTCTTSG